MVHLRVPRFTVFLSTLCYALFDGPFRQAAFIVRIEPFTGAVFHCPHKLIFIHFFGYFLSFMIEYRSNYQN